MENEDELSGLRGWLILVGIGVVVSPIRLLVTFLPIYTKLFSDGTWEALTSVDSEAYTPLWAPVILTEVFYNTAMVLASIYLIYLFFAKHYLFPKFYIGIVAISLIVIPLDAWLVALVFPDQPILDPDTVQEFLRVFIAGIIWVPYLLLSKRVKATFVRSKSEGTTQLTADSSNY